MNLRKIVSLALILFGVLLFTNVIPLATVIYADFEFLWLFPANAIDPNQPYPLKAGSTYTFYIQVKDTTGQPEHVKGIVGNESFTIPFLKQLSDDVYAFRLNDAWTAPELGSEITFKWQVTNAIKDKTLTAYTYGEVIAPSGFFTINGKKVDVDSTIIVYDENVTFGFTATKDGDLIERVLLRVTNPDGTEWNVDATEITADTYWEESYTLPEHGTYTILGLIVTAAGPTYRMMSITMAWGDVSPWDVSPLAGRWNQILGLSSIAIGVFLFIRQRKKPL